jgi:maltose O-acetyltransferase
MPSSWRELETDPSMSETSERQKMLSGELYLASDPELVAGRKRARQLLACLNDPTRYDRRQESIAALFGSVGSEVTIEPPFYCDYGTNIVLGDRVFMNFNCVILDPAPVTIGNDVLIGPAVQIYTATHPLDFQVRRSGREMAHPIIIGDEVWIGGAAILCPGVRIGERAVIGAGAVVTRDVPPDTVVAGNPARVLRASGD